MSFIKKTIASFVIVSLGGCASGNINGKPVNSTDKAAQEKIQPTAPNFKEGKETTTLVEKRTLLASEILNESQIREGAKQYAKFQSYLKNPNQKFSCPEDRLAAELEVEPTVDSVEHADYDKFNDMRESINGHRLKVDNFPCWIISVSGKIKPKSKHMSDVSHLLLAFTEDGSLISRIETTTTSWESAKAKRDAKVPKS